MMRKVYLIGTTHKYQCGRAKLAQVHPTSRDIKDFKELIRSTIIHHSIKAIGEEMNKVALIKRNVSGESIPCELATEIGIPHRYCDADSKTRDSMGSELNRKREQYWINELIKFNNFPILFILGADHVESFQDLLSALDFEPYIVAQDWEPSLNTNTDT